MKIGAMLSDVSFSLFRRPVTERYPFKRREPPERLRGLLNWDPEHCIGCGLCAKDCPANALEMVVLDRKAKRFVLSYYVDRCTFCAQCVHSCRQGCLELLHDEWELAALTKKPFLILFGGITDVDQVLVDSTS